MKTSERLNDLAGALAKAQGQFSAAEREHVAKVVSKKGEGSSYSYNYADLASYLDVCRKPLADNGLSFVQSVSVASTQATVATTLLHESGQWIDFDPLTLQAADLMPQSIGSAITYARRYALSAAIGMASEADDDGAGASGLTADTGRRENNTPPCPKCGTNKSVIVGKPEYGGGFVCFAKKGGCGEKWQENAAPQQEAPAPEKPPKSQKRQQKEAPPTADPSKIDTEKFNAALTAAGSPESVIVIAERLESKQVPPEAKQTPFYLAFSRLLTFALDETQLRWLGDSVAAKRHAGMLTPDDYSTLIGQVDAKLDALKPTTV